MRKINIGSGKRWSQQGWEILDSGSLDRNTRRLSWNTRMPDGVFDSLYTCHMLEHIPHFRLEKTIAEFNRILKKEGVLRIVVPDLKQAAIAYVNDDKEYFTYSAHYTDDLGIGGSFLSVPISPGKQTIAVSADFSEMYGTYAHIGGFDFEMLRNLLEKWGFGDIHERPFCDSDDPDMREPARMVCGGKTYPLDGTFVKNKDYLKTDDDWGYRGFDKMPEISLIVEARKIESCAYDVTKEYAYFKRCRLDGHRNAVKATLMYYINKVVDVVFDSLSAVRRRLG